MLHRGHDSIMPGNRPLGMRTCFGVISAHRSHADCCAFSRTSQLLLGLPAAPCAAAAAQCQGHTAAPSAVALGSHLQDQPCLSCSPLPSLHVVLVHQLPYRSTQHCSIHVATRWGSWTQNCSATEHAPAMRGLCQIRTHTVRILMRRVRPKATPIHVHTAGRGVVCLLPHLHTKQQLSAALS